MPRALRSATLLLAFALVTAIPAWAFAQDVEKQVARMNKKALDDYDSLEFESSRRTLVDAVAMLRSNGLDETPLAAKTYMNLGLVYLAGFKDKNRGVQQFVNALKIKADLKLDPNVATPEIEEAFAQAQKQLGKTARPLPPPPDRPPADKIPPKNEPERMPPKNEPERMPPKPEPVAQKPLKPKPEPVAQKPPAKKPIPEEVKGLVHQVVEEAKPGAPIVMRAQLGSDIGASRVFLLYRSAGQEEFEATSMHNDGGAEWSGTIPAESIAGKTIQYYVEARDVRGRSVVGSGSAANPYIIMISNSATGFDPDREDPLALARRRKKEELGGGNSKKFDRGFIFLMPGFGFGFQPSGNKTEVAWQYDGNTDTYVQEAVLKPGGTTIAPFHLSFEIGGNITRKISLSAMARVQLVTGANAQTVSTGMENGGTKKAFGAVAGLVRFRYKFLDGRFHPYVHLNVGGGTIRHMLDVSHAEVDSEPLVDAATALAYNSGNKTVFRQQVCADPNHCVDSILMGYVLVGGGGGVWFDVVKHLAFIFDLNVLGSIGLKGAQSGLNIDLQLGLGATF